MYCISGILCLPNKIFIGKYIFSLIDNQCDETFNEYLYSSINRVRLATPDMKQATFIKYENICLDDKDNNKLAELPVYADAETDKFI